MKIFAHENAPPHVASPRLHLGFPLFASVGFLALGAAAVITAVAVGAAPPMQWVGAVLLAVALVELASGLYLQQADGDSMQFLLGGALTLTLALIPLVYLRDPAGMALMVAVYLLVSGLFRALDVVIDHPRPWPFEAAYAAVALALAVFALNGWRTMNATGVMTLLGIELLARGVALEGSAWAARRQHAQALPVRARARRTDRHPPRGGMKAPTDRRSHNAPTLRWR